jgi:hypothetical protein
MKCQGRRRILRPLDRNHNGAPVKLDQNGYVMVWEPDHPNTAMKGWQYEHRLVAEATVGRYLKSDEHVHHVNGVKDDNRPENLQVMGQNEHAFISSMEYQAKLERDNKELEEYRRRWGPLASNN